MFEKGRKRTPEDIAKQKAGQAVKLEIEKSIIGLSLDEMTEDQVKAFMAVKRRRAELLKRCERLDKEVRKREERIRNSRTFRNAGGDVARSIIITPESLKNQPGADRKTAITGQADG